jgi:hypothetical protein
MPLASPRAWDWVAYARRGELAESHYMKFFNGRVLARRDALIVVVEARSKNEHQLT